MQLAAHFGPDYLPGRDFALPCGGACPLHAETKPLLALTQRFLGPLARRDVEVDARHAQRGAICGVIHIPERIEPAYVAGGKHDSIFRPVLRRSFLDGVEDHFLDPGTIIRVQAMKPIFVAGLAKPRVASVQLVALRRPAHFPCQEIPLPCRRASTSQRETKPLLAVPQRPLSKDLGRRFGRGTVETLHRAGLIAKRRP